MKSPQMVNRKNREVKNRQDVLDILDRCPTIRLGLIDGTWPYVVPISFGLDTAGDKPVIFIHSSQIGLKVDCFRNCPRVCVEADIFHKVEPTETGITARYESVIGFGTIQETAGEEKLYGMKNILARYGHSDYPVERCCGLSHTDVFKIILDSITGKRNLPQ